MTAPTVVVPLDPNTDKGRRVADELAQVLAQIRVDIAARERAAAARNEHPVMPAAEAA